MQKLNRLFRLFDTCITFVEASEALTNGEALQHALWCKVGMPSPPRRLKESGGMPPRKILNLRPYEITSGAIWR